MPKHHKKQLRAQKHKQQHAIMKPAPLLYKEEVVLTDIVPLIGNDQGGFFYAAVGPNGVTDLSISNKIPQVEIWD